MELNNIYLKKFRFGSPSTAYLIAMIFTMIFLVFMYQPGDVLAGDFRAWVDAALAMKNGEDPYASSGGFFKSGPVSPWYFYFYQSLILSDWFVFNSMQIINLLGVAYFTVFVFTPYVTNKQKLILITIFVLLTSSVREILVDGQVTGIILGGFTYVLKQWSSHYGKKTFRFLLTFPVAIFLIDLKPNLTVPLFAILLFRKMYKRQIFASILLYFFSLTLVTGYLKYNISYLWIANLLDLNNALSDSDLYGSVNTWQVLNQVTDNSQLKSVLLAFAPPVSYLIAITLFGFRKYNFSIHEILLVSLSIPFLYSYSHYYSYAPVVVGTLVIAIVKRWALLLGFLASFHLISFEMTARNVGISALFCVISLFWLMSVSIGFALLFTLGWFTSLLLRVIAFVSFDNTILLKSIMVSMPAVLLLVFFYLYPGRLRIHGYSAK